MKARQFLTTGVIAAAMIGASMSGLTAAPAAAQGGGTTRGPGAPTMAPPAPGVPHAPGPRTLTGTVPAPQRETVWYPFPLPNGGKIWCSSSGKCEY
jgi:hypothetical protein